MGNDLATVKGGNQGLALNNLDSMWKWAGMVKQSGLAPDNLKTQQQIVVATQFGRELGLGPMTALTSICVVKGKPTIWGDAALALVKSSPLLTKYSEKITGVGDAMIAEVISEREGKFTVKTTFSVDDAKTARLWGKSGSWTTHPKRMLKYKARAFNLRDNFPDILNGLHLQEEMVGEVDEPMEAPKCDVAPRNERRKKVDLTDTTVLTDGFEEPEGVLIENETTPAYTQKVGRAERPKHTPPQKPAEIVPPSDSAGALEADADYEKAKRKLAQTTGVIEAVGKFDERQNFIDSMAEDAEARKEEVARKLIDAGRLKAEVVDDWTVLSAYDILFVAYIDAGGTDFTEWAAEALCRDEDEVDSPEKFDADMIARLGRHLATDGV